MNDFELKPASENPTTATAIKPAEKLEIVKNEAPQKPLTPQEENVVTQAEAAARVNKQTPGTSATR